MMHQLASRNPYTEEVVGKFRTLDTQRALAQVKASQHAFHGWKKTHVSDRGRYLKSIAKLLRTRRQEYGTTITTEMGKPIREAVAEVEKCAWVCEYYSEHAETLLEDQPLETDAKKSYIAFEPLGVILAIMPWNFPFWQVFRFAAPALAAGNTCALKHASNVPRCALQIEELFNDAGLPEHVFTTLLIRPQTAMELIESDVVDGVSVTGSTQAGQRVAEIAGKHLRKVVLELGGSDPFIVLEDADLTSCCVTGVQARFGNTGQSCIAAKRFIVVEEVAEEFETQFIEQTRKLVMGDPMDPNTDVGPLARRDLVDTLEAQVRDAIEKGAKIRVGGTKPQGKGFFYPPTVITNVTKRMAIVTEETFGPVAPIIIVNDEYAAVREANRSEYGLGASVWTRDRERGETLTRQLQAGNVVVNGIVKSDPRLPFGGIKKSGVGRELSEYGLKEFVNIKSIVVH